MSVRIYQLSKEIDMDNAELIALLRERGYEVKSASSTIDNISADSLRQEYGPSVTGKGGDSAAVVAAPQPDAEPIAQPEQPVVAQKEDDSAKILTKDEVQKLQQEEEEKRKSPPPMVPPRGPALKAPPPLPRPPINTPTRPVAAPPPAPVQAARTDLPKAPPPTPPMVPQAPTAPTVTAPTVRVPVAPTTPPSPAKLSPPPHQVKVPEPQRPVAPPASRPASTPPPLPIGNRPPSVPQPVVPPRPTGPKPMGPPPLPRVAGTGTEVKKTDNLTPAVGTEQEVVAPPQKALRKLQVKPPIVVRDFAVMMGKKPFQLISDLMEMSIFASMNYVIDEPVAMRLAKNNGFELDIRHRGEAQAQQVKKEKPKVDESQLLEPRPPVVCILGHVDHGKTTLLDAIRHTNVVAGEAGGITQHIGAYQIEFKSKLISFIDTPGHAAFSNMRARGANVTDIAVLVVAADDGFMPQTDEALKHAITAGVPVVVAINKMDARGANIDRVKRQLQERNLTPEDWGGETLVSQVSALKGENIDALLDSILLQAEIMENLKANPKGNVEGVILEAQKELGRGPTASVIVRNGTLKAGDALVCGEHYCRVRTLVDDKGAQIKSAGPATPVKVVGWSGTPDAGDTFYAVKNERQAKEIAEDNMRERRSLVAAERVESSGNSLDDLFAAIAKNQKLTFRTVVKADVFGTAEALAIALEGIKSEKIALSVVDTGVGAITKNDVIMASAVGSAIIAFNVGLENGVVAFAKHHNIRILQHNIIYEIINQVKDAMADMVEPELKENKIGAAEVRAVFPLAKGFVAGCMVTEGRVQRDAIARLYRKGQLVHESRIGTLRRFKDDASEVRAGYECGIQLDGFNGYQESDVIEVFEILKIKPAL